MVGSKAGSVAGNTGGFLHHRVGSRAIGERSPGLWIGGMKNISRIVIAVVVVAIAGGFAFLATWDIPAPLAPVEKVLPDDRFPR
jgi:hypothetical protein